MAAGLEPSGQVAVLARAEDAPAHRGDGDERRVELDEYILRHTVLRARDRLRVALRLERAVHVLDGELEAPHRAVADEGDPVLHPRRRTRVDRRLRPGRQRPLGRDPAESVGPGDADRRAHHAVVDHHDRHRRAAHDVDVVVVGLAPHERDDVQADEVVDECGYPLLGDADEDDGLGVLDQARAADDAVHVHRDEHVDGLAGIAGGVDEVRVEKHETDLGIAGEGPRDGRAALGSGEAIRAGECVGGPGALEEAIEIGAGRTPGGEREGEQRGQQQQERAPPCRHSGAHVRGACRFSHRSSGA